MDQPCPTGPGRVGKKSGCFSPGLGSSSAPSSEGRVDVVAWGLSQCLKGLRVVPWSSSGCSNALQPQAGLLFPAGQQGQSRCLFIVGPVSARGFPCSVLPHPTPGVSILSLGVFAARWAVSDSTPGFWGTGRDFVLGVWAFLCLL